MLGRRRCAEDGAPAVKLVKGPNIVSLPQFEPLPDELELPVLLKVGDDISTDEIMPAGARVLPFRSNIPESAEFVLRCRPDLPPGGRWPADAGGHAIVGGENYGQGSSREHAALAPRYLGLGWSSPRALPASTGKNLVNFGVLPLVFDDPSVYDRLESMDLIVISDLRKQIAEKEKVEVRIPKKDLTFTASHNLTPHIREVPLSGGLTNWVQG